MWMLSTAAQLAFDSLIVLVYTLRLLPIEGLTPEAKDRAFEWRMRIATAIVQVTPSWRERRILATIARYESHFDEAVGICKVLSFDGLGARSNWQIIPFTEGEKQLLCQSPAGDAAIAIERVRLSLSMCRALPPAQRLSAYAAGNCESSEGRRLSEIRWPKEDR